MDIDEIGRSPAVERSTDPWEWTVDDVVTRICQPTTLLDSRPHTHLPNSTLLEQIIRDNCIDGSVLLLEVDRAFLKDVGITKLSEISAVVYVRDVLRNRSQGYQSHVGATGRSDTNSRLQTPSTTLPHRDFEPYEDMAAPRYTNGMPPKRPASTNPEQHRQSTAQGNTDTAVSTAPKRRRLDLQTQQITEITQPPTTVLATQSGIPRSTQRLTSRPEVTSGDLNGQLLPSEKLQIDRVFFGHGSSSKDEINTHVEAGVIADRYSGLKVTGADFNAYGAGNTPSVSDHIYRQMRHYFRQAPVEVQFRGRKIHAIYPYRVNLAKDAASRSVILLEPDSASGELKALHRKQVDLDLVQEPLHTALDQEDFDLLRRHEKDEYDDPDEEFSSSFEAELEADELEDKRIQALRMQNLSPRKITEIIDGVIGEQIDEWKERKLPNLERKALSLWKPSGRGARASVAEEKVSALSKRLEKMISEIKASPWSRDSRLRQQCAILEQTVFDIEDEKFKAQLWRHSSAPNPPDTVTGQRIRRKKTPSVHESDEGGVVLDSDDDDHMHVDELANLIVDGQTNSGADMRSGEENGHQEPKVSVRNFIDLTQVSSESEPPRKSTTSLKLKLSNGLSQDPTDASDNTAHHLNWQDFEAQQDRKRLIIKLIKTMDAQMHREFRHYVVCPPGEDPAQNQMRLRGHVFMAAKAIRDGKSKLDGYKLDESKEPIRAANLFACWYYCSTQYWLRNSLGREEGQALVAHIQMKKQDLADFTGLVERVLTKSHSLSEREEMTDYEHHRRWDHLAQEAPTLDEPAATETETLQPTTLHHSPRKKRKRQVVENKAARERRQRARQNLESQEERRLTVLNSNLMDSALVTVNPGKSEEFDFVRLNSHISSRIHMHQVEGIQFLWREIVATHMKEVDRQGALLSHTMGLGKTMQAISLLVTIAEAAASPNPRIYEQIPAHLRESRTLIICPSTLINNWLDEFAKWLPPNAETLVGKRYAITSEKPRLDRLRLIEQWSADGGVLLISYDLFRALVSNAGKAATQLNQEDHEIVLAQLTNDAHIVIADEAHKLKNPKSGIGRAASLFKTSSRVALTGSPLSNNLGEYYAMIDWIAPGYLGNAMEFRAKYEEPIREGGFVDSTAAERRKAMRKLKVLERVTEPKIHRRDITVLQGTLAPKTEFVLTVSLTSVQRKIYSNYLESLGYEDVDSISQTRIFEWLGMLSLVCSHPMAFLNKLQECKLQSEKKKKQNSGSLNREPGQSPEQSDIEQLPTPQALMDLDQALTPQADTPQSMLIQTPDAYGEDGLERAADEADLRLSLAEIQELESITKRACGGDPATERHSGRTILLHLILERSKEVGDQVLVFSQSIETLNFLEVMLGEWGITFFRLDGRLRVDKRPADIKAFNKGMRDVYLISTRAGGLGINLIAANRVVIFDFMFNPQWEEQAIGRAYRLGQAKPVYVYRFIAGGTFEEKVFNQAVFKTQLAFKVVEKKNTKNYAQRQMDYLFKPKKVEQVDLESHKGKDAVLDDILSSLRPNSNGKCLIRKLISAEILKDPAEDIEMTQEDEQEMKEELANYRLRKQSPAAYQEQQRPTYDASYLAHRATQQQFSDILGTQWSNRGARSSTTPWRPPSYMAPADLVHWRPAPATPDQTGEPSNSSSRPPGPASSRSSTQDRDTAQPPSTPKRVYSFEALKQSLLSCHAPMRTGSHVIDPDRNHGARSLSEDVNGPATGMAPQPGHGDSRALLQHIHAQDYRKVPLHR